MSPSSVAPARNTFSTFLYHCNMSKILFSKWHKLVLRGIAWKWQLISASPSARHFVAHLTTWSLNTPLCIWCRRSGVMWEKILQWERSAQNGLFGHNLWHMNSLVLIPMAVSSIAFNTLSTSHRTVSSSRPNLFAAARQWGHMFSWLQVTKHCSGQCSCLRPYIGFCQSLRLN